MLAKLKSIREDREEAFTLIELLVVILIIGILAAIAIPVFLNQRKTANDGAVESDVRNAALELESWVTGQKGKDVALTPEAIKDIKASSGVKLDVSGSSNDYCIQGVHENGKNYVDGKPLTYSSKEGGLGKACSPELMGSDAPKMTLPAPAGGNTALPATGAPDFSAGVALSLFFGHTVNAKDGSNTSAVYLGNGIINIDPQGRGTASGTNIEIRDNTNNALIAVPNGTQTLTFTYEDANGRHNTTVDIPVKNGVVEGNFTLSPEFAATMVGGEGRSNLYYSSYLQSAVLNGVTYGD